MTNNSKQGSSRRDLLKGSAIAAAAISPIGAGAIAQNAKDAAKVPPPSTATAPEAPKPPPVLPDGKKDLVMLGDRPINIETPPHLLDDDVTPFEHFFVRNNGIPPELADIKIENWRLKIDGEVNTPLELSIEDLKKNFETVTVRLVIECAGNGRKFFAPTPSGNQWTFGGVGFADFTGVRLKDVLNKAGIKPSAVYTGHYGADSHLSGDPEKKAISRGVPIEKAMDENNIIAWDMNGKPLPLLHGFPLRLVIAGYPASVSEKWLNRIWIRDVVHDGEKMKGSYRVPKFPVAPGTEVKDDADTDIIAEMKVKSLITFPKTGTQIPKGQAIKIRGQAWSGQTAIEKVELSIDFGQTWQMAKLMPSKNAYAPQRFNAEIMPKISGYYEVWARATDNKGNVQPPVVPGWNPHGYFNNMQHRIAVFVL